MLGEVEGYGIYYGFQLTGSLEKKAKRAIEYLMFNNEYLSVTFKHADRIVEVSCINGDFHVDDVTNRFKGVLV